jgi:hypothetical protein
VVEKWSSVTSAGEDDPITFTVVYCVFDDTGAGDPVIEVTIGSADAQELIQDAVSSDCGIHNGFDYSPPPSQAIAMSEV